ncbi:hypothetical protein FRZ67_02155 [Panacibacter ginsenosidivorans]|uniref:Nucleotidyltransferase domain-containing protein n=1 Tax=Panacibacter ginsenosidivorans TaxID=1813871 RepID=A0A5B8V535_9BACT|nr:hypothetical protein [Panacibacter ginsenosidivorans]QEC66165.1 hypothetical protein FRZ67_02155 [Panacibacter ginsenosidivorans]
MDILQQSIIKTVAYFDIFNYPMTAVEIRSYMDTACNEQDLDIALTNLVKEKILFRTTNFYQLKHDESLTTERIKANKLAEENIARAKKIASFLTWFPFIKGIAVSGSLSKKVATSKSDYDFFIVTQYNCLWRCRFIFSAFIKLAAVFGLKKYFCLNYVIDESYMEVEEKNVFTATEIATLMPLYGRSVFADFFTANQWIYNYFPNHRFIEYTLTDPAKNAFTKSAEWLMQNRIGQKADNSIMRYFERHWSKLQSKNKVTESGFILGSMMVNKHYCKPYPHHFQRKVLTLHKEKTEKIMSAVLSKQEANDHFFRKLIIK